MKLPSGWLITTLGTFMNFKSGVSAPKDAFGKGVKFVNVMDIFQKSALTREDIIGSVSVTDEQIERFSVIRGDILFNGSSETPNEIAYSSVYIGDEKIVFGAFVMRGRQHKKLLLPEYAKYCFKAETVRKEIIRRGQGAIRVNIGQKDLSKVSIIIPPIEEQKRIASILDEWARMIEKMESLINAKEKQFDWLYKQYFTPNSTITSSWESHRIGDFVRERNEKSTISDLYPCLTSSKRGMFLQDEYFSKQVASQDNTGYKIMVRGDFTFRSMSDNGIFVFNQQNIVDKGLISPAYGVFAPNSNMDADYLYYFLNSDGFRRTLTREIQGGTRLSLKLNTLKQLAVEIPEMDEQKRIAEALNTAKQEIGVLRALVEQYRIQKRGLMQKLLSGEWQVKDKGAV